jgi:hypothetical protein
MRRSAITAILFLHACVESAPVAQVPAATPAGTAPGAPQVVAPQVVAPPAVVTDGMNAGAPPLRAEPVVLDVGFMLPKVGGKGTFTLTNTSDAPITIAAVTPSCKCTATSKLAGTVVAPGKSVTLDAELEGVSVPQIHRAAIRVAVDGYSQPLELQIRGETARAVRTVPALINAVEGKPRQGRYVVESLDGKPFRICAISGRVPDYIGFTPGDAPKSKYLVKYDLDTWVPSFPTCLVVETDHPECPVFDVWIRHETTIPVPGFRMKEYRINAGRIDVGGSAELVVEMDDSGEEILAAESMSPSLRVDLVSQAVVDLTRRLTLRIMPTGPRTGFFNENFKLYGREREQPLLVYGSVRPAGSTDCTGCEAAAPAIPAATPVPAAPAAPATPSAPKSAP